MQLGRSLDRCRASLQHRDGFTSRSVIEYSIILHMTLYTQYTEQKPGAFPPTGFRRSEREARWAEREKLKQREHEQDDFGLRGYVFCFTFNASYSSIKPIKHSMSVV